MDFEGCCTHVWRCRPTLDDSFALLPGCEGARWVLNAKVQQYAPAAPPGPEGLPSREKRGTVEVFFYDDWARSSGELKRGDYLALSGAGVRVVERGDGKAPALVVCAPPPSARLAPICARRWAKLVATAGDRSTQIVHEAAATTLTAQSIAAAATAALVTVHAAPSRSSSGGGRRTAAALPPPPKRKKRAGRTKRKASASYIYTPLGSLARGEANVVGVVAHFTPPRPTSNDLIMTVALTGPSIWPRYLNVNVFARDESALPSLLAVGDVVRGHRLSVTSYNGELQGVGNAKRSSWVVWHSDGTKHATSATFTCTAEDDARFHALTTWSAEVDWLTTLAQQSDRFVRLAALSTAPSDGIDVIARVVEVVAPAASSSSSSSSSSSAPGPPLNPPRIVFRDVADALLGEELGREARRRGAAAAAGRGSAVGAGAAAAGAAPRERGRAMMIVNSNWPILQRLGVTRIGAVVRLRNVENRSRGVAPTAPGFVPTLRFQRMSSAIVVPPALVASSCASRLARVARHAEKQHAALVATLPSAPVLRPLTTLRGVHHGVPTTPLCDVLRAADAMRRDAALPPRKFRVWVRLVGHAPSDLRYAVRYCRLVGEEAKVAHEAAPALSKRSALGYLLALQLSDATATLDAIVSGDDAVHFFGRAPDVNETERIAASLERLSGPGAWFDCALAVFRAGVSDGAARGSGSGSSSSRSSSSSSSAAAASCSAVAGGGAAGAIAYRICATVVK